MGSGSFPQSLCRNSGFHNVGQGHDVAEVVVGYEIWANSEEI